MGVVRGGEAALVPDGDSADVIVLVEDGDTATLLEAGAAEIEPLETIDATRRFARVRRQAAASRSAGPRA